MAERKQQGDERSLQDRELPASYYLDESDPDILILRRNDDSFVAAFSARGATSEGIVAAAREDYQSLLKLVLAGVKREGEEHDT